jgi:hypothetical protein
MGINIERAYNLGFIQYIYQEQYHATLEQKAEIEEVNKSLPPGTKGRTFRSTY